MSKFNHEDLSAFVDGELEDGAGRMIEHLLADEASRRTWMRYHLIAETMRHSLPSHLDEKLAEAVSSRLQDEPTVLSPVKKGIPAYLKPVVGAAVAASVATVAIIGVQQQRRESDATLQENRIVAIQPDIPAKRQFRFPVQPASIDNSRPMAASPGATAVPRLRQSRLNTRLNNYLINHNEHHANAGMQGMLPYVRIVAHDNDE